MSSINWLRIEVVTQQELEQDFNKILDRVDSSESPFLIITETGPDLLLFEWEDYWSRFGYYYTQGEKERVEAECQERYKP